MFFSSRQFLKSGFLQLATRFQYSTGKMDEVILEKINHVGCITLNRPKALNALNISMTKKILPQLKDWENDESIVAILIKGTGDVAFCAGGDIKAIRDSAIQHNKKGALDFFREEYNLNYAISVCKKPYVALINGITMGGGVGLSVHGRYRIATEKTVFAMPETAIGFFPDVGGMHALVNLKGHLGLYLALTGSRLKGKEVFDSEIATHYIESTKLDELQKNLFELKPNQINEVPNLLNKFSNTSRDEIKQINKINSIYNVDSVEQLYKNLENDNSDWSKKQISVLNKMSPTSLKVTLEYMKVAANKSLKDILEIDYQLCHRFLEENDLPEGIRAVLVDKDNKPQWKPAKVNDVTKEKIDWFFKSLSNDEILKLSKL